MTNVGCGRDITETQCTIESGVKQQSVNRLINGLTLTVFLVVTRKHRMLHLFPAYSI